MDWHFRSEDAVQALKARRSFADFLHGSCEAGSDISSAEIVFGELISNVIRHAPGPIAIDVQSDAFGLVTLTVLDNGAQFPIGYHVPPPAYSESGRGLYISSVLCAHMTVGRTDNGNRVVATLPVRARATSTKKAEPRNKLFMNDGDTI